MARGEDLDDAPHQGGRLARSGTRLDQEVLGHARPDLIPDLGVRGHEAVCGAAHSISLIRLIPARALSLSFRSTIRMRLDGQSWLAAQNLHCPWSVIAIG